MVAAEIPDSDLYPGLIGAVILGAMGIPVLVHYARKWAAEARADRMLKVAEVETIRATATAEIAVLRAAAFNEVDKLRAEAMSAQKECQTQIATLEREVVRAAGLYERTLERLDDCRQREADLKAQVAEQSTHMAYVRRDVDDLKGAVVQLPRRKDDIVDTSG